MIFDRNGEKLAMSVLSDSVCADPSRITDQKKASTQIAAILKLDEAAVMKKISGPKNFCWLARKIPPEQAAEIAAAKIEGVFLIKEPKRFYPNGDVGGSPDRIFRF